MERIPFKDRAIYSHTVLALLFVINLLNYIDRLTISGLLEPIRKDLHLSDAQLGNLALAFLIPYAVLPPLIGWIGDKSPRSKLIAGAVAIWSAATAAAGFTRSFAQLGATRVVVGVGEATYMTLSPSIIADLYPSRRRGSAMSLFYTASPVGAALGVFLGGLIAARFGWRVACFVVGIPGILMALGALLIPEPERGRLDPGQQSDRPSLAAAARSLLRNKVYVLLTVAYTLQLFAYNPIEFWLPTILQRDKGLSLTEANTLYGGVVLAAGVLGPVFGGFVADRLMRTRPKASFWICFFSALASVLPIVVITTQHRGVPLFTAIFAEVFLANMSTGLVFAILVTIVIPGLRGTATAVLLTVIHVFGDAISEPLIGWVSTALKGGAASLKLLSRFPRSADLLNQHLTLALCLVTGPAMLLSSVAYLVAVPQSKQVEKP